MNDIITQKSAQIMLLFIQDNEQGDANQYDIQKSDNDQQLTNSEIQHGNGSLGILPLFNEQLMDYIYG